MVDFVALAQTTENGDRIFNRWLIDHNRLEAAFQGSILLDVLAIFVERGRADAVQLTSGQHGLEQVAGVHGAFGLAGADHGVQFIDKEDDSSLRFLDFLEYRFEALLELATE